MIWRLDCLGTSGALLLHDGDDLGNDFASALNHNSVAEMKVKLVNLVKVVQRHMADSYAADKDRLDVSDRCQAAPFAYLPTNIVENRGLLFSLIFVSDNPPWSFACGAEAFALR